MGSGFNDPYDLEYDPFLPDRGYFTRRGANAVLDVHQSPDTDFPATIPPYDNHGHTDAAIARLLLRYGDDGEIVSIEEVQQPIPASGDLYPMKQPEGYSDAEIYPAFAFMAPPDMSYDFKRGLAWGGVFGALLGFLGHFMFARRGRR